MKKGQTNNIHGRPKGKPNKVTTELRQWVSILIDKNRDLIEQDLLNVEPDKRLAIFEKLLQYVIPKQQFIAEIEKEDEFRTKFIERMFPPKNN